MLILNPEPDAFTRQWQQEQESVKQAIPINKEAIFTALAAANIVCVKVAFDGARDDGQIEDIAAFTDDTTVALPSVMVERLCSGGGMVRPIEDGSTRQTELNDAIEELLYDYLELHHSGWEINDGSYGEFILDVGKRTIALGFNERYMDSVYSEYEF